MVIYSKVVHKNDVTPLPAMKLTLGPTFAENTSEQSKLRRETVSKCSPCVSGSGSVTVS